ncbi:hypothetical protein CH063_02196 [Colletotrichum higginsianum]|uniref:Uncharacterized protein n=2 Tax=Colletotrichum higginsianum TaxID=80884 RepID=H1VHQ1_COLHI|nr:hypothetical protein CH63R_05860 [Colletotrichum higginsianum IMI 349063]OBR10168.1 hypothetical protein CH63R_05860 [Colletotrichum higginsianum IMI 349063]TID07638.1 hypothetical protein CH35J_001280 [Colletotrichum higginsianum]CCF39754.1 hypothetical protein CH063_02196 [Colletotrichum higginsianum]
MNTPGSFGIVDYSFPMWSKKHVGSWLDAFKPRRSSTSSSSTSSSRTSSFSTSSRSGPSSRNGSLASLMSMGTVEEQEHLMAEQPKRPAYVPQHAAKSFMKTATSKEIRKNGEIL